MRESHESKPSELLARDDGALDGAAILRLLDKPLSADDLRDASDRVARPLERVERDLVRLLVFQLGAERMAVESVVVHQVTRAATVHPIPHRSNAVMRGLCNLDGDLLLCGDLFRLLELEETSRTSADARAQRRMIVLGDERKRWVFEVDSVEGVATISRRAFRAPPLTVAAALARFTQSLVPFDRQMAAMLDADRILAGFEAALQ